MASGYCLIIFCIESTPIIPVSSNSFWRDFNVSASDLRSARVAVWDLSSDSVRREVGSLVKVTGCSIGLFFASSLTLSMAFLYSGTYCWKISSHDFILSYACWLKASVPLTFSIFSISEVKELYKLSLLFSKSCVKISSVSLALSTSSLVTSFSEFSKSETAWL